MTQLAFEAFVLDPDERCETRVRSIIERHPHHNVASHIERLKRLHRDGWDVAFLIAPDNQTVVLLACREDTTWR